MNQHESELIKLIKMNKHESKWINIKQQLSKWIHMKHERIQINKNEWQWTNINKNESTWINMKQNWMNINQNYPTWVNMNVNWSDRRKIVREETDNGSSLDVGFIDMIIWVIYTWLILYSYRSCKVMFYFVSLGKLLKGSDRPEGNIILCWFWK